MSKNKKTYSNTADARITKAASRTVRSTIKNYSIDFEPQTENQAKLVKQIKDNEIIFATGYPGTGKTFVAIACAIQALLNGECERIIVTRPAVVAGNEIGFMPGDESEKQDVYMAHIYDAFDKLLPSIGNSFMMEDKIQIKAIAFLRGSNFENAYVIVDEAENLDRKLFYLLMTRLCYGSKLIFCGDSGQIDLRRPQDGGLDDAVSKFTGCKGFGITSFTVEDCRRSPIVQEVIKAYFKSNENSVHGEIPKLLNNKK